MNCAIIILAAVIFTLIGNEAAAHPGSGIVADKQGNIYFVDTGSGIYKLAKDGTLTKLRGSAYHWMTIDPDGRLNNVRLPNFNYGDAIVERVGTDPALLLSSDFPVVVGRDGNLYYPWFTDGKQLQFFALDPAGTTKVFSTLPVNTENKPLRWVNGAASGLGGTLYYTEDRSVRKISANGTVSTFIAALNLGSCSSIPDIGPEFGPYLRGIDIAPDGTVYVAATGCGAVVKITADKKLSVVLRSEHPWSPTGVVFSGNSLYVLEYFHTQGDDRREWTPRIRKISPDGSTHMVAEIKR